MRMADEWKVVSMTLTPKAKKVIAYLTLRYGTFEFRNVYVLKTAYGFQPYFPGKAYSSPHIVIHSDTVKHQLKSCIEQAFTEEGGW